MKPLGPDNLWEQAGCSIRIKLSPALGAKKPCSDEVFEVYRRLYDYNRLDLQPRSELSEELNVYTRRERVSYNAAYGTERLTAYVFLPRTGKRPFQTVIHWPGSGVWDIGSIDGYGNPDLYESHPRTGRVLVFPVLLGTLERKLSSEARKRLTDLEYTIMQVRDFRRTIDYLETRPEDFDTGKLIFEGYSWGGVFGGILPAIDPRLKVAVIIAGGLDLAYPAEYNQLNFTPRVRIPVLMVSGKYDTIFPTESHVIPYLRLFGTDERDKQLRIYDSGHSVWRKADMRKDEVEFLNQYLGPAK
jgi:dienelactone hydrolase